MMLELPPHCCGTCKHWNENAQIPPKPEATVGVCSINTWFEAAPSYVQNIAQVRKYRTLNMALCTSWKAKDASPDA